MRWPEDRWSGDVPITARCRTPAVVAPVCPCADRQPGVGRRLCGGHAGGPAAGSLAARRAATGRAPGCSGCSRKIWNSVSVNDNAEVADRCRCRPSGGCPTSRRCRGRPSCCCRWKAFPRRRSAYILGIDVAETRTAGRCRRPRDGGRDRDRRADHRGRDLHRDGPREPGEESRPQRHRRRAHPRRCGGAGQEQAAGPDPGRHPARRRQFRPRCGQRAAARPSRCR